MRGYCRVPVQSRRIRADRSDAQVVAKRTSPVASLLVRWMPAAPQQTGAVSSGMQHLATMSARAKASNAMGAITSSRRLQSHRLSDSSSLFIPGANRRQLHKSEVGDTRSFHSDGATKPFELSKRYVESNVVLHSTCGWQQWEN